jgi:hypothetical protein
MFCGVYKRIRRNDQPVRNEEIVPVRFLFGLVQTATRQSQQHLTILIFRLDLLKMTPDFLNVVVNRA